MSRFSSSRPVNLAFSCLLAASPLAAQTFVVDALGGPGSTFTDLPAAIAFAPSGSTLRVRAGTYSPFQIVNKGLTILGENTAGTFPTVRLTSAGSTITIGPLGANHAVTICGLRPTETTPLPTTSRLDVVSCAAPVVLEDLTLVGGTFFQVTNSPNVHVARMSTFSLRSGTLPLVSVVASSVEFTRLSLLGAPAPLITGIDAPAAFDVSQASRVLLIDSSVIGGSGNILSGVPSAGGPAVVLNGGSLLHAFANSTSGATLAFRGGTGGSGLQTGRGGDALVAQQGSSARVRGYTLVGGAGSPVGRTITKDATSTVDHDPTDLAPTAELVGVVKPGNTVQYTLHARPGSSAGLFLGVDARFQVLPALALGEFGLDPLVSVGPLPVPANGRLDIPSLVPANWPTNFVLLAQFLTFDPAVSEIRASNVFTATSRF